MSAASRQVPFRDLVSFNDRKEEEIRRVMRKHNPPTYDLTAGSRDHYFKICVPLYEASIRCDWEALNAIFQKHRLWGLESWSITENGETALHVAAAVKRSNKHEEKFVKNLVVEMSEEDLILDNKDFNTALYLAAAAGNIEIVRIIAEKNNRSTTIPGSTAQLMPLYVAALFGNYQVVKYLYDGSKGLQHEYWNEENKGSLLEKCVEADMFDIALDMVNRYPSLGNGGVLENLARKPNAFADTKSNVIKRCFNSAMGAYGNESEALQLLKSIWKHIIKHYSKLKIAYILSNTIDLKEISDVLPIQDFVSEHLCKLELQSKNLLPPSVIKRDKAQQLRNIMSKHLININSNFRIRRHGDESSDMYGDESSDMYGDESSDMHERICEHIASIHDEFNNIIKQDQLKEDQESHLKDLICKHITNMRAISHLEEKPYTCRVLFSAAEMGNTKFLVELIRLYPDLILKVNDENQTIFHIAVQHRHEGIYNLLYEIGSVMDLVIPLRDVDQNNMLHLAGKICLQERLADVSGPALQMQRELLWFTEVRNMVPPYFMELRNKDGLTPHELFTKEHNELIKEGQKWMKETASQCMVVATLIATIVFAAAFTIPGGYDQTYGIPIFYRKSIFVAFVVADAMSLFLSSTSILTFLSILTSRYAERDFVESLPTKLMVGISTLFLSITAMMITFGVSFFILYHKKMKWIPILISACGVVPIFLYVALQYHVLADVIRSTYGSKYLFKPRKRVLY